MLTDNEIKTLRADMDAAGCGKLWHGAYKYLIDLADFWAMVECKMERLCDCDDCTSLEKAFINWVKARMPK